jgi:3-hydroxyisobutyrate dehydrogenase-like beta-hydroxyacid dehydrogenase
MLLSGTMPKMVFRGYFDRVTFALKLARKDLGLATEVGRELNVPMPLASLVEQDLLAALANGLGEKDSTAAVTIQEDRAAVKIRTQ